MAAMNYCARHGCWQPPPPRCPACNPYTTTSNATGRSGRDRALQAKFRRAVLNNAGHRCQHVQDGVRCPATAGLQAHHLTPGTWNPADGAALCRQHHRAIDPHAR
jgi:predicted restriction endonuclease